MALLTRTHYITRKQGILGGEPIIAGHRIPVRAIVETIRLGYTPQEVAADMYPQLTPEQVLAALEFYEGNRDEIDRQIMENEIPDELIHPLVRNIL